MIFPPFSDNFAPGILLAVSCSFLANQLDWQRAGSALWQSNLPAMDGRPTFVERPKVIYIVSAREFVMWMQAEQPG